MLDLTSLEKVLSSFESLLAKTADPDLTEGLDPVLQKGLQAGIIQHFEFTYELS